MKSQASTVNNYNFNSIWKTNLLQKVHMWSDLQRYQVCNKKKYQFELIENISEYSSKTKLSVLREFYADFYSLVLYLSKKNCYTTQHLQLLNYKRAKPLSNNIFFSASGSLHISLYIFYICKHVGVPGSGQCISEKMFLCACGECAAMPGYLAILVSVSRQVWFCNSTVCRPPSVPAQLLKPFLDISIATKSWTNCQWYITAKSAGIKKQKHTHTHTHTQKD